MQIHKDPIFLSNCTLPPKMSCWTKGFILSRGRSAQYFLYPVPSPKLLRCTMRFGVACGISFILAALMPEHWIGLEGFAAKRHTSLQHLSSVASNVFARGMAAEDHVVAVRSANDAVPPAHCAQPLCCAHALGCWRSGGAAHSGVASRIAHWRSFALGAHIGHHVSAD